MNDPKIKPIVNTKKSSKHNIIHFKHKTRKNVRGSYGRQEKQFSAAAHPSGQALAG